MLFGAGRVKPLVSAFFGAPVVCCVARNATANKAKPRCRFIALLSAPNVYKCIIDCNCYKFMKRRTQSPALSSQNSAVASPSNRLTSLQFAQDLQQ
jgi:hypothetical protein